MEPDHSPTGRKGPPSNKYLKYSNFALQLLGAIGFSAWLGIKLDKYLELGFPVFLLSFVLLSFGGMMYQMVRNLNKE